MVNSCDSDSFPEDQNIPINSKSMDTASYKYLKAKTEVALCSDATKEQLFTTLTTLLKDCGTCINQSLSVVTMLLSETEACVDKIIEYLSDAVNLLDLLTSYIKNAITMELTICCEMKTFPTSVGLIIITVFSHCKDSEPLYGSHLSNVEIQLKGLFRNCHELQLTYLMILEKHLIFNPIHVEEKSVLLEALDLNQKIGKTVQSLDVKSMAVQWKALTILYEKYSANLLDTTVYENCMSVLCPLVKTNIKTAVEDNQDEKVVIRSLKVANFLLKTLLKACDIFKHATRKEYTDVISLLFYINETSANLHTPARSQFKNLIEGPSENLLKNLLCDEIFCKLIFNIDVNTIKDGSSLGYIITVTCVMDYLTEDFKNKYITKSKLIDCLFSILSRCNTKHIDVTLHSDNRSHCLFEHLLIHTLALALTLNCEEYNLLERCMVKALLSTDHISALFASNVWTLLHMAKDINPQLLFNQIIWLCTMYKKLENHRMFNRSPQKLHLTHTIGKLFSLMENEDKMKICKQFRIHDDDNLSLWSALGVKNLPPEAKSAAETVVAEKLKTQFQCFNGSMEPEDIDKLTKVMSIAATCNAGTEAFIMRAWSKTCASDSNTLVTKHVYDAPWFRDCLQALVGLTEASWHQLSMKNGNLIKILHYVTSLIQQCGVEFKLLFINILCKLSTTDICEGKLDDFTLAFTTLYNTSDIVRNKLLSTFKGYKHKNIDRILSNIDLSLQDSLHEKCTKHVKYSHKCQKKTEDDVEMKKTESGNFDFAKSIDTLFENDSDFEESACKKVKMDCSESEVIIKRLETETAMLRSLKGNVFTAECKSRIQNVCDDLYGIIH